MKSMWQALQLRVTTFHAALRPIESVSGLSAVFSVEPESIEVKPPEFRRTEIGLLGGGRVTNTIQFNRVDWVWQSIEDSDPPVFSLGEAEEVLAKFMSHVRAWLSSEADVLRLAVGGQFGIPVESRESGYVKLNELISEVSIDPETSDFMYQINRPKSVDLGASPLVLNRVEKWGCRAVTRGALQLNFGAAIPIPGEMSVVSRFASVELDFNSDASATRPMSSADLLQLSTQLENDIRDFLAQKK